MTALVFRGVAYGAPPAQSNAQPIIALKGYVGLPEGKDAEVITSLIDDQFEVVGFASRTDTINRILGGRLPRRGIRDRGLSAADLIRMIDLGYTDWYNGLFADAVKKLIPAKEMLFRNSGLLVTDTKNLDSLFKGLVVLSLSQRKLNPKHTEEADKTMAELVRIFRTRPVARGEWGVPAEEYWRGIAKPILAGGTGQLYVTTGNEHAVIYVDNQIRGIGKAEVDLLSGEHHVLVQVTATAGLQYTVDVKANEDTRLDTNWDVDTALTGFDPLLGFVYTSEVERSRVGSFAGDLAERWGGQGMLAVVDIILYQGDPVLIGTLYRARGKMIRRAEANLAEGDRTKQVHDLAQFLQDGTTGSLLKIIQREETQPAPALATDPLDRRSTLVAKTVLGAGALAITSGGLVYLLTKPDDYTQPTYDDKRTPAVQVIAGGSVVLGAGLYLWLRESDSVGTLPAAALGAGSAGLIAGSVLYLTSEGLHSNGYQRPYYRPTATIGVVVGSAGIALTGAGLWLWHREGSQATISTQTSTGLSASSWFRASPVVVIDSSHALVGWSGRF